MKIPKSTKDKLAILALLFAAVIFCILWLSAKIDINKFIRWDRFYCETRLSSAADSLEKYISGGDVSDWNAAGEQLHAFSALMTASARRTDKNPHIRSDADAEVAEICGDVAEKMLAERGATAPYAEKILSALRLLEDDSDSPEAVKILAEIMDGADAGAYE